MNVIRNSSSPVGVFRQLMFPLGCRHIFLGDIRFNLFPVGVIIRQCGVHMSEGQMGILEGNFFRVMPILYQPTMRRTVKPVPAILGRPPRIVGSRSISVPISMPDAIGLV